VLLFRGKNYVETFNNILLKASTRQIPKAQ
jgi:hypothetical protein